MRTRVGKGRDLGEWWPVLRRSAGRWSGGGGAVEKTERKTRVMAWYGVPRRLMKLMRLNL